ncbi:ubiquitin-like domain-containing protein CIP73 isoform X1 [Coffea eugenioides]|uniref:ubiquitin-like domain-containing protein CIP73 isoform X1 n=1 Tax=Coffea eugenioides TaxID=49369 RepID=UPI000F610E51|nr:ubiquitin-like domain-containing protein CIP73 isoform X1 [Coffea eugenioides]
MADHQPIEGSSTSNVSGGSPESTVELNIKTLDSQIYSFHADKDMPVSALKEKIASQIGVPVEQQRLIFRGKVLKDDHLLSEYYVENGHTLHLVERQATQQQPSSSSDNGNTRTNTGRVGQEPGGPGGSRNRMGQISHSVVLGTFNVGEQGENVGSDLSRVIGAVLNSIGIGGQPGTQPSVQVPQRSATGGVRNDAGHQNQGGNQSQPGQSFNSQPMPHAVQIPLGAAVALPSLNMPIPDSLNTIYEFVNRLEQGMSQQGYQPSQSPNITGDPRTTQLPSTTRGVPTPEALSSVLRHAQHLLGGHAVAALSHVAGRLEQEAGSNDPTIRGQIQTESAQVGLAMQHIGALLLEIGRTMLTLRMGQSPAESSVNAGPAVYVSPSGPNPIMVQPFPLQTSSLFGSSASAPSNPGAFGPVGIGNISRHVNIHIHTGTPLAPFVSGVGARTNNGEGTPGERANGTASGESAQSRVQGVTNVNTTAVPLRPAVVAVSGTLEPSVGVSLPPDLFPLSTVVSEVNSQIRNFVGNIRGGHQALAVESSTVQERAVGAAAAGDEGRSNEQNNISSGHGFGETSQPFPGVSNTTNQETQPSGHQPSNSKDSGVAVNPKYEPSSSSLGGSNEPSSTPVVVTAEGASSSSQAMDTPGGSSTTPLGLGLGSLQPKRRSRQSRSQGNSGSSSLVTSNQTEQPRIAGQQVLQSLASLAARSNGNTQASGQLSQPAGVVVDTLPPTEENADGQFDIGSSMSQVLQSPALNGLLAGVSQQTGIGSPNALRNIMEQLTQNPAMRNTVNQIAQQIDNHDLGNMFSSLGGCQGGGFDLSRMMQQMMPIVSQALGGVSTGPQPTLAMGPDLMGSRSTMDVVSTVENSQPDQVGVQQVARGIEQQSPPGEIFRSMVENALQLCEGDNVQGNVVNELCSDEGLANEFMEMLRQDISRRLDDRSSP